MSENTQTIPKVSVIIPAYNVECFIEKCLLSIHQQTFNDFEIIVVDDCSTDRTYEFATCYARVIRNEKNFGEGEARNIGASASRGEILVFTDADVVTPPNWLHNIVETMAQHNVPCVGGGYCGSIGDTFVQKFAHYELELRRSNFTGFVKTLVSNNFACSRKVFFEHNGFPSDGYKCEDIRLSYKISKKYNIFWDSKNNVFHHFRRTIMAYLKQQYFFSRDTVWMYYQVPDLLLHKTHQGRGIYFEAALTFMLLVSLSGSFFIPKLLLSALTFLFLVFLVNLRLLTFLQSKGLGIIKSFSVVLLRDVFIVAGFFEGVYACFNDFLSRSKAPLRKFFS